MIFNGAAAFTSDYRCEILPRRNAGKRIFPKEAKIWLRRRTRGGHKGNRAIIVNRLTTPLPPFNPLKRVEKLKRRRRGLVAARRKLSDNRVWSHPLLHHPLISANAGVQYRGICGALDAHCPFALSSSSYFFRWIIPLSKVSKNDITLGYP